MREEGLAGKKKRQFRITTQSDPGHPVAENVLDQDFAIDAPDSVWSGDITYLRTREGWLYLAVLVDLCSRLVVGWSLSRFLDQDLVLAALERGGIGLAFGASRPYRFPTIRQCGLTTWSGLVRLVWEVNMPITNISEAKAQLSALIERVLAGEEIIIGKAGKPVAKLIRFERPDRPRRPGALKGRVHIADDFDELPEELRVAFGIEDS